jgi:hypothetical protein
MRALVSPSGSILVSLRYVFKLEHFIIYVSLCNSRIYVITLYSGHVCVYYASMLRYWHLIWILVRTDHPYLGVRCHTDSSWFYNRAKRFVIIQVIQLMKLLSNEPGLIPLNGAISMSLYFEYPFTIHQIAAGLGGTSFHVSFFINVLYYSCMACCH